MPTGGRSLGRWLSWEESQMEIKWRLRMAAAQREVWTAAQLRRLLAERAGLELSSASVSALFAKQPAQLKLSTLAGLCTALECTPNDLFLSLIHISEPTRRTPISYAVFCLKKKKKK